MNLEIITSISPKRKLTKRQQTRLHRQSRRLLLEWAKLQTRREMREFFRDLPPPRWPSGALVY